MFEDLGFLVNRETTVGPTHARQAIRDSEEETWMDK